MEERKNITKRTYLGIGPRQVRVDIRLLHAPVAPAPGGDAREVDTEGFGEVADGGGREDVCCVCGGGGVEAWVCGCGMGE